mgnify:CR=1 FL=1
MPDSVKPIDKLKLPSRHVSVGPEKAPHRSYYYAMGMTEEEIAQPLIGVVSTWNEAAPCNISLARQAQAAKRGVRDHAGSPATVSGSCRAEGTPTAGRTTQKG